ncbi:MAG: diguanylate cyclase [Rhizobium sp.]|nr:diguanylate cyclase [Rhizobium sp.]
MTGLLNRRAIERHFEKLRTDRFTALAVIDVDHFKAINDGYGHGVGDEVLKAVAAALKAGPDVRAYRLGGEEFLQALRGHTSMKRPSCAARRSRRPSPAPFQYPCGGRDRKHGHHL